VPAGLPFSYDATSVAAAEEWNLICADGEFDISGRTKDLRALPLLCRHQATRCTLDQ
jgi:hypothetical protein